MNWVTGVTKQIKKKNILKNYGYGYVQLTTDIGYQNKKINQTTSRRAKLQ